MAKKNLKISALKYEIYHNIEQTLEVLQQLGFVAKSEETLLYTVFFS